MDATNPRILWAGFWQVGRKPWSLESGGPGGGVWKTTDGGDTWKKLAGGLPEGVVGRVGIAVSPARPERAWAVVEAEKGGVFRTDDGGETWKKVNDENKLRQRAWYYSHVYADPANADAVYVLNVGFFRSGDGGKTFDPIRTPHGDNHDLWIDPNDPQRMIEGNDGGATVTVNGGRSWSSILNQPTAQFYRVTTDGRFPYRVFGAQQDNTTVEILSRTRGGGVGPSDWHPVGGCESGWIAPKPDDPDVSFAGCYGGAIDRYDHRTGEDRNVVAWPQLAIGQAPKDLKYRFQWNAPILISPHDAGRLYHAAQVLLKSTDDGATWTEISPDLTRNEKATQGPSGGPITFDNTGVEVYGVIFALAESPHEAGTIWAGTDDGLVQLTRDGGKNWANVTPKGLPERVQVNSIEISPHDAASAWIAATMYKHDDARPYLYRTTDYGKTWTKLVSGIPDGAFTRVVREDPVRKGLVFAGTERGLFVSFDDGAAWQPFQRNLPVVPITDLTIKDGDLVVATQGRAFWILDDLSALRQWIPAVEKETVHLFKPRPAVRFGSGGRGEGGPPRGVGPEPAAGRDPRRLAEGRAAEEARREGRAHARDPRRRHRAPDVHLGKEGGRERARRGGGDRKTARAQAGPQPAVVGPPDAQALARPEGDHLGLAQRSARRARHVHGPPEAGRTRARREGRRRREPDGQGVRRGPEEAVRLPRGRPGPAVGDARGGADVP